MNRIVQWVVSLVAVIGLAYWTPSFAEGVKIGYVNPDVIVQQAPQAKEALKLLEKEFTPRNEAILKLNDEIREKGLELEKNVLILTESEIQSAKAEINMLQRRLSRTQDEAQEDYNLRKNVELTRVLSIIREVIVTFAKEENYDLILDIAVVYVSPTVDLTERILEELGNL